MTPVARRDDDARASVVLLVRRGEEKFNSPLGGQKIWVV
jgi:hypothetical protein